MGSNLLSGWILRRAVLVLLIAVSLGSGPRAQARNCPSIADQTVPVAANTATPVRLAVREVGAQTVTIFQHPQGGQLVPAGGSGLDYFFLPDPGFSGMTRAIYRVSRPDGCPGTVLLGNVTFLVSGPTATAVDLGGNVGLRPTVCGVDFLPIVIPPLAVWFAVQRRGARRRSCRND